MVNHPPDRPATWPDTSTPSPAATEASAPQPAAGRPDRLRGERIEGRVQTLMMLAIGTAAGAASFRHVHDVAAAHGQPGWLAWTDAVTLELTSIAAGLDLRRRKRIGKSVLFPGAVLFLAVTLSLAAQVVEAEASVIGWLAAALPALGFLAMVKMALGRADPGTKPEPSASRAGLVPDTGRTVPDRPHQVPDRPGPSHTSVDVTGLLPAATAAARTLAAQQVPLNRTTLARQMRADGHPLSTAAATVLTRLLRQQPTPPAARVASAEATA